MVRTQIQLSDELYRELKALADEKEWSLAEAIRRAAEQLLRSYPRQRAARTEWQLPGPFSLGTFQAPVTEWRELANAREGLPRSKP
jgi:hypothetical protein